MREQGVTRMTVEGVASAAGVSKGTIYRWWKSKGDLALDAARDQLLLLIAPAPTNGSLRDDLLAMMTPFIQSLDNPRRRRVLQQIVAEAQSDPHLAAALYSSVIEPHRSAHAPVFEAALSRAELTADVEFGLLLDMLYGAVYHRLLLHHDRIDADFLTKLIDMALDGAVNKAKKGVSSGHRKTPAHH